METRENILLTDTAICVFAFKRPDHLRASLSALLNNEEARELDLRIYVDAPVQVSDVDANYKVLSVCHQPWAFRNIKVIQRETNVGLYKSLTGGISETLRDYNSVIVVEDDIEASPFLIRYLLDGLHLYSESKDVASIHGYTPPIKQQLPETFFLRGADCWGWATWRDRWQFFRHDAAAMAEEIRQRGLVHEFNLNGNYDYLGMLDARAVGLNSSWAICWHASCFLANKLTLYPGKSLVRNIGLDGSGEHCAPSKVMATEASQGSVRVENIPVEINPSVYFKYCNHFADNTSYLHFLNAIRSKLKKKFLEIANRRSISQLTLIGPFNSFEEAASRSTGYNANTILEQVESAVLNLIEGNSGYERDGTFFANRPPNLPIEQVIRKYASSVTSIVDFGGGLGGMFLSYSDLIPKGVAKYVIEQKLFAEAGTAISKKYNLDIIFSHEATSIKRPSGSSLLICSSVLMYLPDWRTVLRQSIAALAPDMIFIDRQALSQWSTKDKFYVQENNHYYSKPISYPFVISSKEDFINTLKIYGYKLVLDGRNPLHTGWPTHYYLLFTTS